MLDSKAVTLRFDAPIDDLPTVNFFVGHNNVRAHGVWTGQRTTGLTVVSPKRELTFVWIAEVVSAVLWSAGRRLDNDSPNELILPSRTGHSESHFIFARFTEGVVGKRVWL
jgi:hypothetical protein